KDFTFQDPSAQTNGPYTVCATFTLKTEIWGDEGPVQYEHNPGLKKITKFEVIKNIDDSYDFLFLELNGHRVYSRKSINSRDLHFPPINFRWMERGAAQEILFHTAVSAVSNLDESERMVFAYEETAADVAISPLLKG